MGHRKQSEGNSPDELHGGCDALCIHPKERSMSTDGCRIEQVPV